jgi:hypothetical protein
MSVCTISVGDTSSREQGIGVRENQHGDTEDTEILEPSNTDEHGYF